MEGNKDWIVKRRLNNNNEEEGGGKKKEKEKEGELLLHQAQIVTVCMGLETNSKLSVCFSLVSSCQAWWS